MKRPRPSQLFGVLFVVGISGAVIYEMTRTRTPSAPPVESAPPLHADEIERLEGGFEWTATRGGRPLFRLEGTSMVRMAGGVQLVRGVERLSLFLEDGRSVQVRADRGRMRQAPGEEGESVVRLEENVTVEDPDGTLLATDVLEYDSARGELRCITPTRISGPMLDADVGSLVYRPDSRVIEGLRTLLVRRGGETPWRIDTSGATYRMTTGELVFDDPFRLRTGASSVIAGPGVLEPDREEQPATFRGTEGAFIVEIDGGRSFSLAAAGLEAAARAERLSTLAADGPASVLVRESRAEGTTRLAIASGGWRVLPPDADPDGRGARITAGPGYRLEADTPEGVVTVRGGQLSGERGADGGLLRLDGIGGAELTGPGGTAGRGETLGWSADQESLIELRGAPARASRGRDSVEAPRIVFDRASGRLHATEGILAELREVGDGAGVLFRGDEPVRVRAQAVSIPRVGGEVTFDGPVQAWQDASTMRAARLRYGRQRQQLVAEGRVDLRVDRPTPEGASTLRLRGERLDYSIPARVAVVSGPARYAERDITLDAEVMRIDLDEASDLERLVATNNVRLVTKDAVGRADRLVWEGGATGEIVLIGERDVASLRFTDGERTGTLRVGRLRYDLKTGEARVDSGPGRGTLESAPGAAGAEERPAPPGTGGAGDPEPTGEDGE